MHGAVLQSRLLKLLLKLGGEVICIYYPRHAIVWAGCCYFFYFLKYMHLIKQLISQKLRLRQIVCILRREYVWLVLPFLGRHIKNEVSKAHKVQAKIYRTGTTLLKLGKSIRQNVARLFMLH